MSSHSHSRRRAAETARATDLPRQIVVAVSAVISVVGAAIGSGAFGGTPIAKAAGGILAADATLVAPDGPAFTIWTPIYLGLLGYAGWQALPARRTDPRQRRVGWLVAATMLLNTAWIFTIQAGRVTLSVAVIAVLLVLLVAVYAGLLARPSSGWVETVLLDGTIGLYLGWVSVATIANTAAALLAAGYTDVGLGPVPWAILLMVVAAIVGVVVAGTGNGRFAYATALIWGLAWVAVGRSSGSDEATGVAVAAVAAAVVVLAATLIARLRGRPA